MSPAPMTPIRTRVGVALEGGTVRSGNVDTTMGLLLLSSRWRRRTVLRSAYGSIACNATSRLICEVPVRLALVTEGMIHRPLDELMDWLAERVPEVRDLEVGTGGYSPLGHSPLRLSAAGRRGWHARLTARGFRIAAFNVSGNPLHPNPTIARRHDRALRRTIELAADLGVD